MSFPSLTRKAKCRFCGEELREKNYQIHLQRKHPNENATNKRSAGQKSLFDYTKISATNAGTLAANVGTSAANAATSAASVETSASEINAETLAANAENSAADVETSASAANAETSAADVETLAANAETSAVDVNTSSANVETSAVYEGISAFPTNAETMETSAAIAESPAEERTQTVSCAQNEKFDRILEHIKRIEQRLDSMQPVSKKENSNLINKEADDTDADLSYIFQSCRSISDITSFFEEFSFSEKDSTIICRVCVPDGTLLPNQKGLNCHPSIFTYSVENGIDFPVGSNLPPKFRNLKRHLKDHLSSTSHKKSLELIEETAKEKLKYANREIEVGMRIGRIAYKLYYKGRPYTDFEEEIALNIQNGCDMGDINHSIAFAKKFLPYVSNVVKNRLKAFLNNRLIQTGFQPPLKIIADKATWKHRTRQFIMAVTVIPDSAQLIQALYLGHPVIKAHNGQAVAESIISCMSEYSITKAQFNGGSFDGQYFNLSVPDYLSSHFSGEDKTYFYDWDPMHKAGLIDNHLRRNVKFSWIVAITETISSIFGEFNYGKEYENLRDASCQQFNLDEPDGPGQQNCFKSPIFFSETRFANYCKFVYKNFREDYKSIVTVFEQRQEDSVGGNSLQREKAASANLKMNKIFNVKFCLRLSGMCDLYDHFSKIICDLQKVDILPHERYAEFTSNVDYLQTMSCSSDKQKCPCSQAQTSEKVCFWPTYHADCKALEASQTYQGVPLFMPEPENFNITRSNSKKIKVDPMKNKAVVESELTELSLFVIDKLKNVFTEDDLKLFEHVRVITDLKLLAMKIKLKGVVLTAASELEKFLLSVKTIVHDLKDISPSQLELQYRIFLDKMEEVIKPMPMKEYKELTSISLIKTFLSSKLCLFKNIELIMHSICVASTIFSVESICESLTSTYEYHNSRRRQITEETALHEMMISVNGPLPTNSNSIISEAMNSYFAHQKDWHFVRRSNNLKDWTVSKCADKLMKRNSSLPFMDTN